MAERSDCVRRRGRAALLIAGAAALLWYFPLFRIKPLPPASSSVTPLSPAAAFDPKATAETFWRARLTPATTQAADLATVVQAVRADPAAARKSFGKAAGVGVDYFFVRGRGKIVARERNLVRVAVDGAPNEIVALRTSRVFGNTVRDGTGLLDVNAFPGLQEFNSLSAELNALVKKEVLPVLREKAQVGTAIRFAGCAEAPESASEAGAPSFTVVPVQAEVP